MREAALLEYRANPTNFNFNQVAKVYDPWLRGTARRTLGDFRQSSRALEVSDLTNEGLLSISKSARRFVHFCGIPGCGRTFLDRSDLLAHAEGEHFVRGAFVPGERLLGVDLVSIELFCETSAHLAMRRTAKRMLYPEVIVDEFPEVVSLDDLEGRAILNELLRHASERLSGSAMALLVQLINGDAVPPKEAKTIGLILNGAHVTSRIIRSIDEVKEDEMTTTTTEGVAAVPEKGPRWKLISLPSLKESAKDVLGIEPQERTVRAAYEELLGKLQGRELAYVCGRCSSPIDGEMRRCWACGAVISDGEEDPEMKLEEIQSRAKSLGISIYDGKNRKNKETLSAEIEAIEKRRRETNRDVDLRGIEAQKLNEALTEAMPDGWKKNVGKQFTSYLDPDHTRRFLVMFRGLRVHFSVDDGFFPDPLPEGCQFLDAETRHKKHFGRDNYIYTGDISKVVLAMAKKVFSKYAKAKKPAK